MDEYKKAEAMADIARLITILSDAANGAEFHNASRLASVLDRLEIAQDILDGVTTHG